MRFRNDSCLSPRRNGWIYLLFFGTLLIYIVTWPDKTREVGDGHLLFDRLFGKRDKPPNPSLPWQNDQHAEQPEQPTRPEYTDDGKDNTGYSSANFTSDYFFHAVQEVLPTERGLKAAEPCNILVKIIVDGDHGGKKVWIFDMEYKGKVVYTATNVDGIKSHCQIYVLDSLLVDIVSGRMDLQKALTANKVIVTGLMKEAAKLKHLLQLAVEYAYEKQQQSLETPEERKRRENMDNENQEKKD